MIANFAYGQRFITQQTIDDKEAHWVKTSLVSNIKVGGQKLDYESLKTSDQDFNNLAYLGPPIELIHESDLILDRWIHKYENFELVYEMRKAGIIELCKIIYNFSTSNKPPLELGAVILDSNIDLKKLVPSLQINSENRAQVYFEKNGHWDWDKRMELEFDESNRLKTLSIEFNIAY